MAAKTIQISSRDFWASLNSRQLLSRTTYSLRRTGCGAQFLILQKPWLLSTACSRLSKCAWRARSLLSSQVSNGTLWNCLIGSQFTSCAFYRCLWWPLGCYAHSNSPRPTEPSHPRAGGTSFFLFSVGPLRKSNYDGALFSTALSSCSTKNGPAAAQQFQVPATLPSVTAFTFLQRVIRTIIRQPWWCFMKVCFRVVESLLRGMCLHRLQVNFPKSLDFLCLNVISWNFRHHVCKAASLFCVFLGHLLTCNRSDFMILGMRCAEEISKRCKGSQKFAEDRLAALVALVHELNPAGGDQWEKLGL